MIEIRSVNGAVLYTAQTATDIKTALEEAVKADANLADANLADANLADANLADANLARAYLARANLADANLADANLAGANLARANLAGANLAGANLAGAYLAGANLAGANLAGANLAGANLARANLAGANLAGAYLAGAYLAGANLAGAYLADAYLADANLARAYLAGASLAGANGDFATPEESDALLARIAEIVLAKPDRLEMATWHGPKWDATHTPEEEHSCGTPHCLAGWAQALCPLPLVRRMDPVRAGLMLIPTAAHLFYATDDEARAFLEKKLADARAKVEAS